MSGLKVCTLIIIRLVYSTGNRQLYVIGLVGHMPVNEIEVLSTVLDGGCNDKCCR